MGRSHKEAFPEERLGHGKQMRTQLLLLEAKGRSLLKPVSGSVLGGGLGGQLEPSLSPSRSQHSSLAVPAAP